MGALGGLFTFRLAIRDQHSLVTTGPYAVVRHPAYTGSIVGAVGTGLFFLGPGSYLLDCGAYRTPLAAIGIFIWVAWKLYMAVNLVRRTKVEDEFLKAQFGKRWVEWSQRVRYRIFPGIY